jgi:hypothetical protein
MAATAKPSQMAVFTAMDAWLYCCKLIVMGAMFEYAWILRIRRRLDETLKVRKVAYPEEEDSKDVAVTVGKEELCGRLDARAFAAFNVLFVVFVLVYFTVCII